MKKLPRSKCLFCDNECKRSTTKYCSYKCRALHLSELGIHYGGPPRTTDIPRECPYCKSIFLPNNFKVEQKYCSKMCAGKDRAETTAALGRSRKGRKESLEVRARMSLAATKRAANSNFTKGIGGIRDDIGHYVRSSWEANIARILKYESIDYKYEPDSFKLIHNDKVFHYIPDFKLKDRYIEVKGWWNEKSLLTKQLMAEQYPNIHIEYISESEYILLTSYYPEYINEWEFKRRPKSERG